MTRDQQVQDQAISPGELGRYSRQMMLSGWDTAGQLRLRNAEVFVAGAGGLGSPVTMYLAAAGVGTIYVMDCDTPDFSNLNRQLLHSEDDVGKTNKAISAKMTLGKINPHVRVVALPHRLTSDNASDLVPLGVDVIVDCLDNFDARYMLNRISVERGVPFVHASIWGWSGRITVFEPPKTACLRCLYQEGPPPGVFPVVGVTPGVLGMMQAAETLKYIVGGPLLTNRYLVLDLEQGEFYEVPIRKDPNCPTCGSPQPGG
jgi:molybdopterin-synthase adenylyltransferase